MKKFISSTSNDLIKRVLQLQNRSRARKKAGLFVIEGRRELILALNSGYALKYILVCEDIMEQSDIDEIEELDRSGSSEWIGLSLKVYQHLSHRKTTEGILAIAHEKTRELEALELSENPLVLVAEASEKPGNIGALLRTADAAALDAVIIANPKTDLFNPNIIRSSLGCVFTNQVCTAATGDIISFLKKKGIRIYAAALVKDSLPYDLQDYCPPTALVVGTEDSGLSHEWFEGSDHRVVIPMEGKIDSLNVSVSAAILIFEAKRQRNRSI